MLDFCAEHNMLPEIELIDALYVNEAYKRVLTSDVRYRFVIDAETFAWATTSIPRTNGPKHNAVRSTAHR